jgi:hypothetical protein
MGKITPSPPPKKYYTVKGVADYFSMSPRQVYSMIERQLIPVAIRFDRAMRLDIDDVEAALRKSGNPAIPHPPEPINANGILEQRRKGERK